MPIHKGGKRGRNHGQGERHITHSRFKTFANLIANSQAKKLARMDRHNERMQRLRKKRVCTHCGESGFRTKRALARHEWFKHELIAEQAIAAAQDVPRQL